MSSGAPGRWFIALAAMLATILEVLDVTIGNVSLPHMRASFAASTDEVTWVLTSYMVANGILIPMTGWFSAYFGRKRFFMGSTIIFTVASMLCGLAWNLESMVVFRILQGIGGAAMIPMSQAVMMEAFPPAEQGFAMAIWGAGMMGAPVFGPSLGGWITDNYSWRWIYYVNLPFGLLAIFLQAAFIPDSPHQKRPPRVDYLGFVLVMLAIGCVQIVLDRGERVDWFAAPWVTAFLAISGTALVTLIWWELRVDHPIVDLSLFRIPAFSGACLMSMLLCFTLFGNLVTWPLYLQQVMGYTALTAGEAMAPRGIAMVFVMLLIGRLYGRVDIRVVILIGFLLVTWGTYQMTKFTTESTFWGMVAASVTTGLGSGLSFVPLSAIALGSVPVEKLGNASGLYNLMRNAGGSAGIAVASTFLLHRAQLHQTILSGYTYATNPAMQRAMTDATGMAGAAGIAPGAATDSGMGMVYRLVQLQASVLSFADVFFVLTVLSVATIPFLALLGNAKIKGAPAGH